MIFGIVDLVMVARSDVRRWKKEKSELRTENARLRLAVEHALKMADQPQALEISMKSIRLVSKTALAHPLEA